MTFSYFADRESPWLLSRRMAGPCPVADLRKGPLARFLSRPAVQPVVAACGGVLDPADLRAVASPDGLSVPRARSRAALQGLTAACAVPWHDFELTLSDWGIGRDRSHAQLSRPGGNIVLQMGFPSDHAALMGRFLARGARKEFEECLHPIRETGRPTMAWARLDVDLDRGAVLIEEVQTDWLRFASEEVAWLEQQQPRSRRLRVAQAYDAQLRARYGRIWSRAILLAALHLAADLLGCRDIWMHRPGPGAILKGIRGRLPPRSLYSALPKSFGFAPVSDLPLMLGSRLERGRQRQLDAMAGAGEALFWRMRL